MYTVDRISRIWDAVRYNSARKWAFYSAPRNHWLHPDRLFENAVDLHKYVVTHRITDLHVKALPEDGGREWVVDVDFHETDSKLLQLKIDVAACALVNFFGDSVAHVMHSGNRGIHVWLKIAHFRVNAPKELREKYFGAFVRPKRIDLALITPNCFLDALQRAVERKDLHDRIIDSYGKQTTPPPRREQILFDFFPEVDRHVFCGFGQIRAPFSYNYKSGQYSHELY
jgi:hypothetical protein